MSSPSEQRLSGSCSCGAVRYIVEDIFDYALTCHRSNCRRIIGPAFKPFARSKAAWHQISDDLPQYQEFPE